MSKKLSVLILALFFCFGQLSALEALESWKDQILYFVMIDRFSNGCAENDLNTDPDDLMAFHGGDIKGLIQKLDYLQKLGVTGIWLSPFFDSRPEVFYNQAGYHGYWPWNFWEVDKRFGTLEDLKKLRAELTRKDMKLLFDMVVNHMGYDAPFVKANPDWFNPIQDITDWNCPEQLQNRSLFGLPDFASEKPVVKTFFKLVARHWNDLIQPDGYRLDAVKHVPMAFWQEFNQQIVKENGKDFLLLGEYLDGNPDLLNKAWQNGAFSSLFDFPLYYTLKDVFANEGDCRQLGSRLNFDRNYPDAGMLATFLDNHDLERFITSCAGDMDKYRLAMAFLMTARGIPTLCYGDEYPIEGDYKPLPENRKSMVFDTQTEMFQFTSKMIEIRKENDVLRRGLQCHLHMDATSYAFARLTADALAVMVVNNAKTPRSIEFDLPFAVSEGIFIDSVTGRDKALVRDGRFSLFLKPKSFALFLPSSAPGFYEKSFRSWQRRWHNEYAWGSTSVRVRLRADYMPEKARFYLIGNHSLIGNWNTDKAVPMKKVGHGLYEAVVKLPLGTVVECKTFYSSQGEINWQPGENTIAHIAEQGSEYLHLLWPSE